MVVSKICRTLRGWFRDVGVEGNFYSFESDSSVDIAITDIEQEQFVAIVEQARTGTLSSAHLIDAIPAFIAHLEVRSRHLRMIFSELAKLIWNNLLEKLEDPAIGSGVVREHLKRNPGELRTMAARELRSKGLPPHRAPAFAKQMANLILAMPDDLLMASFWEPIFPHIRAALKLRMEASIKQALSMRSQRALLPRCVLKSIEGCGLP